MLSPSRLPPLLKVCCSAITNLILCAVALRQSGSKITVRFPGHAKAVATANINAGAQNLAREVCDLPGNLMNPTTFVARARKEMAARHLHFRHQGRCSLNQGELSGPGAGWRGWLCPPALMVMKYTPKKVAKSAPKLALVGKGITFDSGGISLKPGAGMWGMKGDMGGAAAVLGAMKVIAKTKPKVPVTAYFALAENMPDSQAQRPGDIYKARNGTYVHVDNTDAEGRLVLSDVLTYACEQGATHMVNAATLNRCLSHRPWQ